MSINRPVTREQARLIGLLRSHTNEESVMVWTTTGTQTASSTFQAIDFDFWTHGEVPSLTKGLSGTGSAFLNNTDQLHSYHVAAYVEFPKTTTLKSVYLACSNTIYPKGWVSVSTSSGTNVSAKTYVSVSAVVILNPGDWFTVDRYTPEDGTPPDIEEGGALITIIEVS